MCEHATLIKFGQHEHIAALHEEGLLYMNNLPYFWRIEDKELRGDPFDGIDKVARGCRGTIRKASGKELPCRITKWTLRMHPSDPEKINIFCMYAARLSVGSLPVNGKVYDFGDYALVMTDPQRFIDLVGSSLESQGISHKAGLVEYVDEDYAGELGPFRKLRRFAYQSEWRLVCYDGPGEARKIRIGDIRDLSVIMPSKEIHGEIRGLGI